MTHRLRMTTSFTQSTKTGSRSTSMENEKLSLPEYNIPEGLEHAIAVTSLDRLYNWGRRSSVWPLMFGLACCAIEMIVAQTQRYDMAHFRFKAMRSSPSQAELLLVFGTVTKNIML